MSFRCDLYCLETDEGFVTHVAQTKKDGLEEFISEFGEHPFNTLTALDTKDGLDWLDSYKKWSHGYDELPRVPINLPHDGETFIDLTLEDFLGRLLYLKETGYTFPDYVIDTVKEEIEESKSQNSKES